MITILKVKLERGAWRSQAPSAFPRTSGWIAQWEEMLLDSEQKLARPRQVYKGNETRDYVAVEKRG